MTHRSSYRRFAWHVSQARHACTQKSSRGRASRGHERRRVSWLVIGGNFLELDLRLVVRLAEAMAQRRLRRSLCSPVYLNCHFPLVGFHTVRPVIPEECVNYHHGDDVRRRTRYETRGRVSAPEIPRRRASIGLIRLVVIQCVLLYIYLKPIAPPRAPYHWLLPQFLVQWYTVPRIHLLFRSRRTAPAGEVAESVG